MRLRVLMAAGLTALILGSCDDSDQEAPDPSAKAAEAVNGVQEAYLAADGATACGLMTPRGQHAVVKVLNTEDATTADSCEGAIRTASPPLAESDGEVLADEVTAKEVKLSDDGTAAKAFGERPGSMRLVLVDGEWLVDVPFYAVSD